MAMQRAAELSLAIALLLGSSAHAIEINGGAGPIKTAPVIERINGPVGTPTLNTPVLPANFQTPGALQTPAIDASVPAIPEAQAIPALPAAEGTPQAPGV